MTVSPTARVAADRGLLELATGLATGVDDGSRARCPARTASGVNEAGGEAGWRSRVAAQAHSPPGVVLVAVIQRAFHGVEVERPEFLRQYGLGLRCVAV